MCTHTCEHPPCASTPPWVRASHPPLHADIPPLPSSMCAPGRAAQALRPGGRHTNALSHQQAHATCVSSSRLPARSPKAHACVRAPRHAVLHTLGGTQRCPCAFSHLCARLHPCSCGTALGTPTRAIHPHTLLPASGGAPSTATCRTPHCQGTPHPYTQPHDWSSTQIHASPETPLSSPFPFPTHLSHPGTRSSPRERTAAAAGCQLGLEALGAAVLAAGRRGSPCASGAAPASPAAPAGCEPAANALRSGVMAELRECAGTEGTAPARRAQPQHGGHSPGRLPTRPPSAE